MAHYALDNNNIVVQVIGKDEGGEVIGKNIIQMLLVKCKRTSYNLLLDSIRWCSIS